MRTWNAWNTPSASCGDRSDQRLVRAAVGEGLAGGLEEFRGAMYRCGVRCGDWLEGSVRLPGEAVGDVGSWCAPVARSAARWRSSSVWVVRCWSSMAVTMATTASVIRAGGVRW
ncbi:hypothetical protein ACW4TU_00955 [Streptomyces sp. QTS52]